MSLLSNLPIARKLSIAFIVLAAMMCSVNGINYEKLAFIRKSSGWTIHTYKVLQNVQLLKDSMVDQETGVRGYLISGNRGFLGPCVSGQSDFNAAFDEARRLTADNPAQQARLGEIGKLAADWHRDVAEKEIGLMPETGVSEPARRLEAGGAGKAMMDGIRATIAEMDKAERDLMVTRSFAEEAAFD